MVAWPGRRESCVRGRPQASRPTPPPVNHAVLTGTLGADPQEARSPNGDHVVLLRVEFPVADPDRPWTLWTSASCLVEVPGDRAKRDIEELRGGAAVLVAGPLSERWMIEGGHTSRRGVIVATLVKSGPPPGRRGELFLVEDGP